jgi:hypothetical protein
LGTFVQRVRAGLRSSFSRGIVELFRRAVVVADGVDDDRLFASGLAVRQVPKLSLDPLGRVVGEQVGGAGLADPESLEREGDAD